MAEKLHGFFKDDGTPVNPNLIPIPSLCASCKHNGDPNQEILCILNRIDQQNKDDFKCEAYIKIIELSKASPRNYSPAKKVLQFTQEIE